MINLEKGIGIDLTKEDESLELVKFRLSWKPQMKEGEDFDLDASALVLGDATPVDEDFIFFKNLKHYSGAVVLDKDDRKGGDGETIVVDISKIPRDKNKIVLAININDAIARRQSFGLVRDSKVVISNARTGKELAKFDLGEEFGKQTCVVAGEFYPYNGGWRFKGIGEGYNSGLAGLLTEYGFMVAKGGR